MSPEKGLLEQYIEIKSKEGNLNAVAFARTLREQFGDIITPLVPDEGGGKT